MTNSIPRFNELGEETWLEFEWKKLECVERNGSKYVQKDFKLSTIDIVSDPSGPGCFVQGIMENVEWFYDPVKGTWHEEKLHNIKNSIHNMSKRELEEKKLAIFEDYITSLSIKK